ncbi:MAG: hypothetical protein J0651_01050 [Actinobacteria bacterium]|nr:hypothetical protein [Actinomycetota bacterium]
MIPYQTSTTINCSPDFAVAASAGRGEVRHQQLSTNNPTTEPGGQRSDVRGKKPTAEADIKDVDISFGLD